MFQSITDGMKQVTGKATLSVVFARILVLLAKNVGLGKSTASRQINAQQRMIQ